MTWLQSRTGAVVDLVTPEVAEVDFPAIAAALGEVNRFAGNALRPVSVALHTVIGLAFVPPALVPWWLLHDAHEARLGDTPSPAKAAARHIAAERYGPAFAEQFATVFQVLEDGQDRVIHAAAGLDMPTPEQRAAIAHFDLVALATEQRWFLAACRLPWLHEVRGVKPHPVKPKWLPADKAGDALLGAFRRHLPALKDKSGRAIA